MIDFFTFSLIIDDIVFPDGRSFIDNLGGGGVQTAFGLRLWAERVGLVAVVGADLPASARAWLAAMDIDATGLHLSAAWPTLRAWQILAEDGRRSHVWRSPKEAIRTQLGRYFALVPPTYYSAKGIHLGVHLDDIEFDFLQQLRDLGAMLSIETYQPAPQAAWGQRPLADATLHQLLTLADIFSPNEIEAASLVGVGKPLALIERLASTGARLVALRQGAAGATVHRADTGETWHIPALAVTAVDPVGAGNAFCGGFLAGWVQTGDLRTAGLYGAVSASFVVEQVGVPPVSPNLAAEAHRRLALLTPQAQPI